MWCSEPFSLLHKESLKHLDIALALLNFQVSNPKNIEQ